MDDRMIADLYWQQSQQAFFETQNKYGHYCYSIASNVPPTGRMQRKA